jgi:hypothetical protein
VYTKADGALAAHVPMSDGLEAARRYAAGGHKNVGGWLTSNAASTLVSLAAEQERLGLRGGACEIGVYHGKLFILLCLLLKADERALAIDLFGTEDNNPYGMDIRQRFVGNLARHRVDTGRVEILATNSMGLEPARIRETVGPVRIFSVDGGHSAEETANDLSIAAGSLIEGGLVILDDFFNPQWPAVAEGTCRFMAQDRRLEPVAVAGNRFIFSRGNAELYRRALSGAAATVFGHPVVFVPFVTLRTRLKATPLWRWMSHRRRGEWARRALAWLR